MWLNQCSSHIQNVIKSLHQCIKLQYLVTWLSCNCIKLLSWCHICDPAHIQMLSTANCSIWTVFPHGCTLRKSGNTLKTNGFECGWHHAKISRYLKSFDLWLEAVSTCLLLCQPLHHAMQRDKATHSTWIAHRVQFTQSHQPWKAMICYPLGALRSKRSVRIQKTEKRRHNQCTPLFKFHQHQCAIFLSQVGRLRSAALRYWSRTPS